MRILLVFHGWFPSPGRPVAGGALRAWHHAEALRAAGHDVHTVTRAQDVVPGGPPGFATGAELRAHAERIQPDALLVVQPEEAPELEPLGLPMVVDLYAPRMLEAQFQDATGIEGVNTLRAIRAGDFFLFSNHRQRFYFLGLLALAGVDLRSHAFGAVVPLVAPEGPERRRPRSPLFVMGGVSWPWIDPVAALGRAVAHLKKRRRGKLLVLGHKPIVGDARVRDLGAELPAGQRLEYGGVLPYDELLACYAGATAAIDMMASTPERELAVAFRHMDYLGCGLPMIVGDEHVLAGPLRAEGAGLVGPEIEDAIDAVLDDPDAHERRGVAARALARERFGRDRCEAPLLAWLEKPVRRTQRDTPLGSLAEASARAARAERGEQAALADLARLGAEVEAKRGEVAGLVQQTRVLGVATERLAGSVAEVAGFKREAIAVLGGARARAQEALGALQARSATLEADVAKKDAELSAALREGGLVRDRVQDLRTQLAGATRRLEILRSERDAAAEAREEAQADAAKKSAEIDAHTREKRAIMDHLELLQRRERAARAELTRQGVELGRLSSELGGSQLDAAKKSAEIEALQVALEALRLRADAAAAAALDARTDAVKKGAESAALQQSLDRLRSLAEADAAALLDARADVAKKGAELEATRQVLAQERRASEAGQLALLELRAEAARAEAELAAVRDQLDGARARIGAIESTAAASAADAAAKGAELAALQREAERSSGAGEALRAKLDQVSEERGALLAELARGEEARGAQQARLEALEAAMADALADIEKKNGELESAWGERERLESLITELRQARR
jgi:hypothetical protein